MSRCINSTIRPCQLERTGGWKRCPDPDPDPGGWRRCPDPDPPSSGTRTAQHPAQTQTQASIKLD